MSAEERMERARRFYQFAKKKLSEGDADTAEKYLLKAEQLHFSTEVKDLLNRINRGRNKRTSSQTAHKSNNPEQRTSNGKENLGPQPGTSREIVPRQRQSSYKSPELNFTKEQRDAIMRIARCKNYYEILEVTENASDGEIQAAYKKLAIIVHPDKNRAPGATQAFQEVTKAQQVLADPEKRKKYDLKREREMKSQNVGPVVSNTSGTGFIMAGIVVVAVSVCVAAASAFFINKQKKKEEEESQEQ